MPRKHEPRRAFAPRTILAFSVALFSALFFAAGCGYHIAGSTAHLPSTWHTIAVPTFKNDTSTYRVEQRVTNAVVHEMLARTRYRIVPSAPGADAVLHGEITSIQAEPLLFDASSGHVTTFVVTLRLKVSLIDAASKKTVYQNDNFVFRDEYQISGDVTKFFQEEDPAFGRMSRDFAADLVSSLLEGF